MLGRGLKGRTYADSIKENKHDTGGGKMKISSTGLELIKEFEGCSLNAYRCPAGVLTIGYGHTGLIDGHPIKVDSCITLKKAEALLLESLNERYEPSVRKFKGLNQNQYDALVAFCYNLGPYIFKGELLKAIQLKNWKEVGRQMLLYDKAKVNGVSTRLKGLTRRREAEVKLLLKEEVHMIKKLGIELNGVVKVVEAIEKDEHNYVKLQDLRDEYIDIAYETIPIIRVKK